VRRANDGHIWRGALTALVCTAAAVVGACAGGGGDGGYTSVEYGYGVYYGSAVGYNDWYAAGGRPVYVGPPVATPPPGAIGGARPPHVSNLPARPLPPARPVGGGGGRRR
jgi:hypothetical protein